MAQQTIIIEVPGTPISGLPEASSVTREDTTPVVQEQETKQASIGQISDLVKSELGTAALKNESDFSTPDAVAAVESASQQRDDAQNERIDAVEYGLTAVANGADKSFTTYAQMIAYVPPEPNVSVRNNDPDLTLRGTYTWTGSQYVKGYDPLDAANTYTDQKVQAETTRIDKVESVFEEKTTVNLFDKTKAVDQVVLSYLTGLHSNYPQGLSFGKQKVVAGSKYVFSLPVDQPLKLKKVMFTYHDDTFLGMDHTMGSQHEKLNDLPADATFRSSVTYSDNDKTVAFQIPAGSTINYIAVMIEYTDHTNQQFLDVIDGTQFEIGTVKTEYQPASPTGKFYALRKTSLPDITLESEKPSDTFTVTLDGLDAYIRTRFSSVLDVVQQVRYGSNIPWENNIINPWSIKTIPAATSKDGTIAAFATGTLFVTQGDDAAPANYNGTYIGGNHGALVLIPVTHTAHGKGFKDVGSIYSVDGTPYTIMRVVDANNLWLLSQNSGTSAVWSFKTDSIKGKTLVHVSGGTNTADIVVSTSSPNSLVQLRSAINNHRKTIIADGFRELTATGVYDVEYLELVDSYSIMNVPAILSYIQAHVGTTTEQYFNVDSIASDFSLTVNYLYTSNGVCTVSTETVRRSNINFNFLGMVQCNPYVFTGKTLHMYLPKMNPVTVGGNTYNLSNVVDITTVTDVIPFLKASWSDENNPPDRIVQLVKNGSVKEVGQAIGYSLDRGITKPEIRKSISDAGFFNSTSNTKKMYPKALVTTIGTVTNSVAYRAIFNPQDQPEATAWFWYQDNGEIRAVLDIHQNASMLKLKLPSKFNGKTATVIESNTNFTLHSEIVSNGGLLCSVINSYAYATIKLS